MSAVIIAVTHGKGGVSKTTTSVNLAGSLNELGCNTCLIDWDTEKPDAYRWMKDGDFINWIRLIDKNDPINEIEHAKKNYDVIIFDTPPNYEANAFKAVMSSDFVIIPASMNYLDQENTKEAITIPLMANKPFKILMSRIKKGTKEGKEITSQIEEQIKISNLDNINFKVIITDRNVIAQSPNHGQWVGQFAKGSDSHKQFIKLAKEVISWIGIKLHARGTIKEEVVL